MALTEIDKKLITKMLADGKTKEEIPGLLAKAKEKMGLSSGTFASRASAQATLAPNVSESTKQKAPELVQATEDLNAAPDKTSVMDVVTGKKNIYGEDIQAAQDKLSSESPILSSINKNAAVLNPVGMTKELGKGVIKAGAGALSLAEKGLEKVGIGEDTGETLGQKIQGSEMLQSDSALGKAASFVGQVAAPLVAAGPITGILRSAGATGLTGLLTKLGASEKTIKALAGVGGALAASPLETAAVTTGIKGELPSKGELGVGMVLDTVIPGYSAFKALRAKPLTEAVSNAIETGIVKGVKPSVSGKKTLGDYETYLNKAEDAVKTIVANKNDLKLFNEVGEELPAGSVPKTLQQFSDALDQTKSKIFAAYDDLVTKTGETGLTISPSVVTDELQALVNNKAVVTAAPDIVKYANEEIARLGNLDDLTPAETQEAIKMLNGRLKTFYQNPTTAGYGTAQVDALIANKLRETLDSSVDEITGGGAYQELKTAYGSLKTIEKDVLNRAIVEARKAGKSLLDFSDIFSAGDIISGLASGNPALVAKGVVQTGIKNWFKNINSPNAAIEKMFSEADKLLPPMQISGAGIEEIAQDITKNLPETLSKEDVGLLIVNLIKGLTQGEPQDTAQLPTE